MGEAKRRGTYQERKARAVQRNAGLLMDEIRDRPKDIGRSIWIFGCEVGEINYRVRNERLAKLAEVRSRYKMNTLPLSAMAIGGNF